MNVITIKKKTSHRVGNAALMKMSFKTRRNLIHAFLANCLSVKWNVYKYNLNGKSANLKNIT